MSPRNRSYLIFILSSYCGYVLSFPNVNFWQCKVNDKTNKQWIIQNIYQKVAVNLAFAQCKKESSSPESCSINLEACEEFNQGLSIQPKWICTALDKEAASYISNPYMHREDAALAAKAYCKQESSVPETCYINLVTCENINQRS